MVALSGDDEQEDEEGAKIEKKEKQGYDPMIGLVDLIVAGRFMFLHYHFNFRSLSLSILTKVSISQIVYTPIFNTYFFAAQSLLAGNNIADTIDRVINAVPVSVVNSVMVWPAVTGLTFLYVQPQYRSLFSGVVAIGWQTYLSWLNSKAAKEVSMERVEEKGKEKMVEEVDLDLAGRRVAAA
ncbi:hypothetical protein KEM56_005063 [Ascosphaera pollenicola]|nr:hypothetical protein KEM56_005063 [Ascosphaera pollenicola]